mgnify:CR=1 FL=1
MVQTPSIINQFIGKYSFLDLSYPFTYSLYGITFNSLLHYYYAFKCTFLSYAKQIADSSAPDLEFSKLCKSVDNIRVIVRSDWITVRRDILYHGLYAKFSSNYGLRYQLLNTGDAELIYGVSKTDPTEDDLYLGRVLSINDGQNTLGELLMELRNYFKNLSESNVNLSPTYSGSS